MRRRPVADDIGAVAGAVRWAGELAAMSGLSEDIRYGVEVCLEEALVNLVCHGRSRNGGKDIVASFRAEPPGARLVLSDRCLPFDSAGEPLPDKPTSEVLTVGGQGLRLLRAFCTGISYRSTPDGNELTLVFGPRSPATDGEAG
jgi:anti-sigma regulatory factor (Ser/Thr protein kinase)